MSKQVGVVFAKELREVLRDRRTLIFMLLVPTVAVPLFMWISTELVTHFATKLAREEARVLLLNPGAAPELVRRLRDSSSLEQTARRIEQVLVGAGLSVEELALLKGEPKAFMRLLEKKGIAADELVGKLRRATGTADLDADPKQLLAGLAPPRIQWLEEAPAGVDAAALAAAGRRRHELLEAVRRRKLAAAVEFDPRAESLLGEERSAPVKIFYLESSDRSRAALKSLRRMLATLGREILAERLRDRNLDPGFARPLAVRAERLPGPGFMAKLLSMLLPYMILIFALAGAMYPAIDLGAGEKERGTLETLLAAPVDRLALVLGKFGVVMVAALVSALLATLSLTVSMRAGVLGTLSLIGGEGFSFSLVEAGWAFLVVIPTAGIFAALLLVLSVFARSFKEAQSYANPLQMFVILPAFVSFIPGVDFDAGTALIPVVNVSLALKAIFTGNLDQHYLHLGLLFLSSAVLAAGLLLFTTWWFRREQVLFRG
ncbi:MAG: hypothetical protein DRI34_02780 [Deltaproteobacteria bacterium]|nr:MAG: hypothetical protein DRI34_02780 [Deltaproteobacteria bacterium]